LKKKEGENMPRTVASKISSLDFDFQHQPTKIVANRNCQEIKLAGVNVGPFEEGNEYETYNWVALELEKTGIVHFREDENLNMAKLNKLQWSERVQTIGQVLALPQSFYPRVRRYLSSLRREASKSPEKMLENEKARQLTRDVVNSRLKKIVSIASAPAQTEQTLKNLTGEERFLYYQLYTFINGWRTQIVDYMEGEE
jgi:hypothetical protein